VYAIQWAEDRIKEHYRAHARASYFLHILLDITTKVLANWLANNDPRWELYKKMANLAEKWSIGSADDPGVRHFLGNCVKMLQSNASTASNWLLTRLKTSSKLNLRLRERLPSADPKKEIPGDLPGQLIMDFGEA